MHKMKITGGHALNGTVETQGAKNAALPIGVLLAVEGAKDEP